MKKQNILLCVILSFMMGSLGFSQDSLAPTKLVKALVEEVSGEIAYNYTVLISHFDRIQASEGLRDSALMIKKELEKLAEDDR